MGFATITDTALLSVFVVTGVLLLISAACLTCALLLRYRRLRGERRLQALEDTWRVLCHQAMVAELPAALPALGPSDARLFAQIWLDFLNRVRGDHVQQGLKHLARRIRLDHRMLRLVRSHRTDDQLLALMVLGRLQDSRVLPLAERCLHDTYALLSLSAAQALMRIDAHAYTRHVLMAMSSQPWPLSRVRELLSQAPTQWLSHEIHAVLNDTTPAHAQRILRVLADLGSSDIEHVCSLLLGRFPGHPGMLASVLSHTANPSRHALAIEALSHDDEPVRLAACQALGRIGLTRDRELLRSRWPHESRPLQRAIARTLMVLPRMDEQEALDILASLSNEPALSLIWLEVMLDHGWGEDLPFQHWMVALDA